MQDIFDQEPTKDFDIFGINSDPWHDQPDQIPIFDESEPSGLIENQENMIFEPDRAEDDIFYQTETAIEIEPELTDMEGKSSCGSDYRNESGSSSLPKTHFSGEIHKETISTNLGAPVSGEISRSGEADDGREGRRLRTLSKEDLALSESYLKTGKNQNAGGVGEIERSKSRWFREQRNLENVNIGANQKSVDRSNLNCGNDGLGFDIGVLQRDLYEINQLEKLKNQYSQDFDYHNYVKDMMKTMSNLFYY